MRRNANCSERKDEGDESKPNGKHVQSERLCDSNERPRARVEGIDKEYDVEHVAPKLPQHGEGGLQVGVER